MDVLYRDVPTSYQSVMGDLVMNLYRDFGYNILNFQHGLNYKNCIHNARRFQCKVCMGSGIYEHNKHRPQCKVYSPIICEVCYKISSKGTIKIRSKVHL